MIFQNLRCAAFAVFTTLVLSAPGFAATLLFDETHDYGINRYQPERFLILEDDAVRLTQNFSGPRANFTDSFVFGASVSQPIGRFELTLTFSGAGPTFTPNFVVEQWSIVVDGSQRLTGPGGNRRYQSSANDLQDINSPQTLVFDASIDGAGLFPDSDAFQHSVNTGVFTFWGFDWAGSPTGDTMFLDQAQLQIFSGATAPIPLPAPILLLLGALGGLAALRRAGASK